jgi:hypothetical protein
MGKKTPKTPDPYKVADAQTQSNIQTAQEQARLGMTGQQSDLGSVQYVADPSSPSGYKAVSSLSPEEKALLTQQQGTRAALGTNIDNTISTPFSLDASRGTHLADINKTFLDPQWDQQSKALESTLLNKGIRPGSEQYDIAMRQFGQQKDDAYNKMFLDAFSTANNAALTERNLPISDYAALNGLKPATPAPVNTPAPGVSTTPVGQYVYDSSKQNQANAAAANQGLYGLAGTLGSAYAGSSAGSAAITALLASDRRIKTDIKRVGKLDNGLPVYAFRYKFGPAGMQIGLMADEVKELHPEAVVAINGIDHVNYAQAVQ